MLLLLFLLFNQLELTKSCFIFFPTSQFIFNNRSIKKSSILNASIIVDSLNCLFCDILKVLKKQFSLRTGVVVDLNFFYI
jgi:hypothetical protein